MVAQVSGPGQYSKRTDTGGQPIRSLPDPAYGEAQAFRQSQKDAPLAGNPMDSMAPPAAPSEVAGMAAGAAPGPPLPDIFGPSTRPDEPVTAGAPVGAGPNQVMGMPGDAESFNPQTLRSAIDPFIAADPTGVLANISNYLTERGW